MNLAAVVAALVCLAVIIVIYRAYKEVNERSLASTVPEGALNHDTSTAIQALRDDARVVHIP
jgi:hypothetical protein